MALPNKFIPQNKMVPSICLREFVFIFINLLDLKNKWSKVQFYLSWIKKNLISLLYHSSKPRLNKLWENLMNISKILIYKIFLEEKKKNH